MSLMFEPLRRYADFEGRSRRTEYWLFVLFHVLVAIAFMIIAVSLFIAGGVAHPNLAPVPAAGIAAGLWFLLGGLAWLALLIPTLAVHVRRLHDIDQSGWLMLLSLIPGLGGIVLLILHLMDGTPGPNRYGPDPKGREPYGPPVVVHHHHYASDAEPPAA